MPRLLPALLGLIAAGCLSSAEAGPPASEWLKVQKTVEADAADAGDALAAITERYPQWGTGWRSLTTWQLNKGRRAEAVRSARGGLAAGDLSCAALLARALVEDGRATEALAVVAAESARADSDGWLGYWGAEAALDLGKDVQAADLLTRAKARFNPKFLAWPLLLEARLKMRAGAWSEAEDLLERAVGVRTELIDAWYELGRVRLLRATLEPARAGELLAAADEAFRTALVGKPADPEIRLAAARSCLARSDLPGTPPAQTSPRFRQALELLAPLTTTAATDGEALALAGTAHLRLGEWAEAAADLGRAVELGCRAPSLATNLALARARAGGAATAPQGDNAPPATLIARGFTAWKAGLWEPAADAFSSAGTALAASDSANAAACWRHAGHAHRRDAERRTDPRQRDSALDSAAACWLTAAELGDAEARQAYLAQESQRDARRAQAAGKRLLDWDGMGSITAWRLLAANYAGAVTGGEGIAGMAARAPLHLIGWAVLVLLPALLAVLHLRRRHEEQAEDAPQAPETPSNPPIPATRPAPPTRSATVAPDPSRPKPAPAPQRAEPAPSRPRPAIAPRRPEKDETADLTPSGTPIARPASRRTTATAPTRDQAKAATEEIPSETAPGTRAAEATLKPTTQPRRESALEPRRP